MCAPSHAADLLRFHYVNSNTLPRSPTCSAWPCRQPVPLPCRAGLVRSIRNPTGAGPRERRVGQWLGRYFRVLNFAPIGINVNIPPCFRDTCHRPSGIGVPPLSKPDRLRKPVRFYAGSPLQAGKAGCFIPHPNPLPGGEGASWAFLRRMRRPQKAHRSRTMRVAADQHIPWHCGRRPAFMHILLPLPPGEGWGEGDMAASQAGLTWQAGITRTAAQRHRVSGGPGRAAAPMATPRRKRVAVRRGSRQAYSGLQTGFLTTNP